MTPSQYFKGFPLICLKRCVRPPQCFPSEREAFRSLESGRRWVMLARVSPGAQSGCFMVTGSALVILHLKHIQLIRSQAVSRRSGRFSFLRHKSKQSKAL